MKTAHAGCDGRRSARRKSQQRQGLCRQWRPVLGLLLLAILHCGVGLATIIQLTHSGHGPQFQSVKVAKEAPTMRSELADAGLSCWERRGLLAAAHFLTTSPGPSVAVLLHSIDTSVEQNVQFVPPLVLLAGAVYAAMPNCCAAFKAKPRIPSQHWYRMDGDGLKPTSAAEKLMASLLSAAWTVRRPDGVNPAHEWLQHLRNPHASVSLLQE